MKLTELLLAQLERESKGTRDALTAVPEGKNDWTPHPKSMPLGRLAVLVATMPSWTALIVNEDKLDLAAGGPQPSATTTQELLALHDKSLDTAREALAKVDDAHLMGSWKLMMGDKVLDDRARHLIIADTLCHHAHHRGQLTVYLRLNDRPVPGIYGPSADTSW